MNRFRRHPETFRELLDRDRPSSVETESKGHENSIAERQAI